MIRVAIVDDQTLLREGLKRLLELSEDIVLAGEADSGVAGIDMIRRVNPDVVLLDVRMPGMSGLDVLRTLGRNGSLPRCILLTTFDDDAALLDGLRAGARGFLLKDVSVADLTRAIRLVAGGETLIRPAVTERLVRGLERVTPAFESAELPDALTAREIEVLRLMVAGRSNRDIAETLGAREGTIKNHSSSIFSKLGVRSRMQAVLKGVELGYV